MNEVATGKPLKGVRVIDLSRLVPGPYSSMMLADLGADVIAVRSGRGPAPIGALARGKRFVTLDLRTPLGRSALHRIVGEADVLIEGFRPGVAARIGAGYEQLARLNPGLIYCSLTGYGQSGPRSADAGHDINYLAVSGVLGAVGPPDGPPLPPLNLLADLGAGAIAAALAIVTALFERARTGRGRRLDVAMVDACYAMVDLHRAAWGTPAMPQRGRGVLSGTAPSYRTYRCADGRYVAVGALERRFFETLWRTLGLREPAPDQDDPSTWPATAEQLESAFASADRDAWTVRFAGIDACVTPVLAPHEVERDPHALGRYNPPPEPPIVDDGEAVLREAGATEEEIRAARAAFESAEEQNIWPPRVL